MKEIVLAFLIPFFALPSASQDAASLIAEGDRLYEQRQNLGQSRLAAQKYGEAARTDPNSYAARWKEILSNVVYGPGLSISR